MTAHVVGVVERAPGDRGDHPDHLLVVDDDAVGLGEDRAQDLVRVARLLEPVAAVEERADHVGLHRARSEQRDVDDQVLEAAGLEAGEELALAGRLDLEAAERA
jgi:hypothetical protein